MMRFRLLRRLAAVVCSVLLFCSGCIGRYVRIEEKGLTCVQAHYVAIEAVRRMGYEITETTQASPGVPGVILASRQEGTNRRALMVSVLCTAQGAAVEARGEGGGLANLNLPAEFRRSFAAAAVSQPAPRPAAERGLDVLVTPARDGGRELLGVDLTGVSILPVSVRITNHTLRTYAFDARAMAMHTSAGRRVAPLAAGALAKALASDLAQAVKQKVLTKATVAPSETLSGVLLFPFDAYTRARVELIDRASDEPEGFSIDF
ncbi:MAG: hypothetical protein ACHQ9S_10240 [Candidatus Binatia bacterium]